MLKVLILFTFVAATLGNIVKRDVDPDNPCYRCNKWSATGKGFMKYEDPLNPRQCSLYLLCWKDLNTGVIRGPIIMPCAPGTWVDELDARRGAPCTKQTCDPAVCDCDVPVGTTDNTEWDCPWVQMDPASDFGQDNGLSSPSFVGSCGTGGYFNDSNEVCTCTKVGTGCTCRVNIPLQDNVDDVSCHKAWVGQTGMPAMVTVAPGGPGIMGLTSSGVFTGYDGNNAPHIATFTLDGAFAGGWVHKLSFGAWFKAAGSYTSGRMAILTMGDCALNAAMAIWLEDRQVNGVLELLTPSNDIVKYYVQDPNEIEHLDPVNPSHYKWYFASVTFDNTLPDKNLKLYVMDVLDFATCTSDLALCSGTYVDTEDCHGTVTPRGCGLSVGQADPETLNFFVGRIAGVKVNQDVNVLVC